MYENDSISLLINSIDNMKLDDIDIMNNNIKLDDIDIMNIIDLDDKSIIQNNRVLNMSVNDWGKQIAIFNQYIQRNILRYMLKPYGYSVYCVGDDIPPPLPFSNNNNSPGFDIIIITPEKKYIRVQSKLRQTNGKDDYSKQINFETTRRNSNKNKDKNHTGHICYSLDEFDFVLVSLVNVKFDRTNIEDCNLWTYTFIPIKEIKDINRNCCDSKIKPKILKKNIIKTTDDIRKKL